MSQPSPRKSNVAAQTWRTGIALIILATAGILSVATSAQPPVIETVSPGIGSSSVAVDQPLEVRFEHPVDADTVTAQTVRLRRLQDNTVVEVDLELTEGRRVVRVIPKAALEHQTDYALELDLGGLTSEDGDSFVGLRYDQGSESVWETSGILAVPFTTRRALTVARAFRQADPDEILVYFSEPVSPALLSLESVAVTRDGDAVPVDLRYFEGENRLRIIPLEPLQANASYTVTLSGAIATPAGAKLGDGRGDVLSFEASEERIR